MGPIVAIVQAPGKGRAANGGCDDRRPDVRAVALVGSWARGTAGPSSDVDLVVLAGDASPYVTGDAWIAELGAVATSRELFKLALRERSAAEPDLVAVWIAVGDLAHTV